MGPNLTGGDVSKWYIAPDVKVNGQIPKKIFSKFPEMVAYQIKAEELQNIFVAQNNFYNLSEAEKKELISQFTTLEKNGLGGNYILFELYYRSQYYKRLNGSNLIKDNFNDFEFVLNDQKTITSVRYKYPVEFVTQFFPPMNLFFRNPFFDKPLRKSDLYPVISGTPTPQCFYCDIEPIECYRFILSFPKMPDGNKSKNILKIIKPEKYNYIEFELDDESGK